MHNVQFSGEWAFYVCKCRLNMDAASSSIQSRTVHPFLIDTQACALGRENKQGRINLFHGSLSEQPAIASM